MRIVNTTSYRSEFLAKLVRWAAFEAGMAAPLDKDQRAYPVAVAEFGNRSHGAYNGRAWTLSSRIRVVTNPDPKWYPAKSSWCPAYTPATGEDVFLNDRMEALVQVLGHEMGHVHYVRLGQSLGRGHEAKADAFGRLILRKFREQRETLLAAMGPVEDVRASADPAAAARKRATDALVKLGQAIAKHREWVATAKRANRIAAKYRRKLAYSATPHPRLARGWGVVLP